MRCVPAFIRDEKGSTAVEFGLVGMLFIAALVGTMIMAQILYFGQKLDYATEQASRQVLIGNPQQQSSASLATFTQALCGYLPTAMSCSNVIVNLYVVPEGNPGYYTYAKSDMSGLTVPPLTPGSGQFSLGNRGDYQYLQVVYPITLLPPFMSSWLDGTTSYKGKAAYLLISTAAFRVEQY
ncbi:TadE/TadG family type IV pilus assembly protein [Methylobacterium sp. Gmos1]